MDRDILDHNRRAWDQLVRDGQRFTTPAREEDLVNPLGTADARGWLGGSVQGKALLCLAGGGGRQSALYARAGAVVTVVDISDEMLQLDRRAAEQMGLSIRCVQASMHDLTALDSASFDVVIHPVSTCYIPDIRPVYAEVARVTKPGGLYISQHKTPTSLQADLDPTGAAYPIRELYYRHAPLPAAKRTSLVREPGTLEFLHRWEELVGCLCRSGFVVEDLSEPSHGSKDAARGSFEHRSRYIAPYVRIKARRVGREEPPEVARVWTP